MSGGNARFLSLDGLRGVAAIGVMLSHRSQEFPGPNIFDHAHLAVDFFFMLSGFVIAGAYERKLLAGMPFSAFVKVRAIRLYPMIVLGVLVGTVFLLFRAAVWYDGKNLDAVFLQFPFALIGAPTPPVVPGITIPFEANPPMWSLFYEILANLIFALIVRFLSFRVLIGVIGLSLLWTVGAALAWAKYPAGLEFQTLLEGVPRTAVSFFAGVLLFRLHAAGRLPSIKISPWILAGGLLALLAIPETPIPASVAIYVLATAILFPLIIMASISTEPRGVTARLASWSGALSYPLYLIHYPIFFLVSAAFMAVGWAEYYNSWTAWFIAIAAAMAGGIAAGRFWDEPVRAWLTRRTAVPKTA